MKVSIERKRPMVKKLFGGMKEADHESAFVTIEFSPQEAEIILSNRLGDRMVYEHPRMKWTTRKGNAPRKNTLTAMLVSIPLLGIRGHVSSRTSSRSQLRKRTLI